MQGKLPLIGNLLGKTGQVLLERQAQQAGSQAARSLSTNASAYLDPKSLKPLQPDQEGSSDLPSIKVGKANKKMVVGSKGEVYVAKSLGVANPHLEGGKNTTVKPKKAPHPHNQLAQFEVLHARLQATAASKAGEIIVPPTYMAVQKDRDPNFTKKDSQKWGWHAKHLLSEIVPLQNYPTRENAEEHGATMTEAIKDRGDAFAKTLLPAALMLATDHPGPNFTNVGLSKDGRLVMFDFDVGGRNSALRDLFTKDALVKSVDAMRGIRDGKVFEDNASRQVDENNRNGLSSFQGIAPQHTSREYYKRGVSAQAVSDGIALTNKDVWDTIEPIYSKPPEIEFTNPEKQRDFLRASNESLVRGQELGEIIVGRLAQAHALVEATRQILPDTDEGLFPSAESIMQRRQDLGKELRTASKEELPTETKEAIRKELIKDAGMEHLDLEFREIRKQKKMEQAQEEKVLAASGKGRSTQDGGRSLF